MAVLGALKMQRREYHRTCYRAIVQTPLAKLLADRSQFIQLKFAQSQSSRKKIQEVTDQMGSQGGTPLEPGSILIAFSLVKVQRSCNIGLYRHQPGGAPKRHDREGEDGLGVVRCLPTA